MKSGGLNAVGAKDTYYATGLGGFSIPLKPDYGGQNFPDVMYIKQKQDDKIVATVHTFGAPYNVERQIHVFKGEITREAAADNQSDIIAVLDEIKGVLAVKQLDGGLKHTSLAVLLLRRLRMQFFNTM